MKIKLPIISFVGWTLGVFGAGVLVATGCIGSDVATLVAALFCLWAGGLNLIFARIK